MAIKVEYSEVETIKVGYPEHTDFSRDGLITRMLSKLLYWKIRYELRDLPNRTDELRDTPKLSRLRLLRRS